MQTEIETGPNDIRAKLNLLKDMNQQIENYDQAINTLALDANQVSAITIHMGGANRQLELDREESKLLKSTLLEMWQSKRTNIMSQIEKMIK